MSRVGGGERFADLGRFSWLALPSRTDLAAEDLFLRKQLTLYVQRQLKPLRASARRGFTSRSMYNAS